MTSISESISWMCTDLKSRRHARSFAAARLRRDALAPYESAAAMLAALERDRVRSYERGEALAHALLAEHRAKPGPLWSGLLFVLCKPMLVRIVGALVEHLTRRGMRAHIDELDQHVLSSFLEALAKMPAERDGQLFARLATETERGALRVLAREELEGRRTTPMDPELLCAVLDGERRLPREYASDPDIGLEDLGTDEGAQIAFLEAHCEGHLNREAIEMLIHTVVRHGRLVDLVQAAHPRASAEELERIYARKKRRHSRAVALMRKVLAPFRKKQWGQKTAEGDVESAPVDEGADAGDSSRTDGHDATPIDAARASEHPPDSPQDHATSESLTKGETR